MRNPPGYTAAWWITLGCASAANVAVFLTSPTVGAQSIVVHKTSSAPSSHTSVMFSSLPHSQHTAGPTRPRTSVFDRRRRQRQRPYGCCVTGTHWTTDLAFSDCENSPSFVKLEGVRRWTLKGQLSGETSYYGSCCRLRHGENAYIILVNGYGPAVHGHALRVDYASDNCSRPRIPFPLRLEITLTAEVPSRCGTRRLYFYGLRCPSQLAFSTSGMVDARQCPPVLSVRPLPLRPSLLEDRLRRLCVNVFACLVLIVLILMQFVPLQVIRHSGRYWRQALCFRYWIKRGLRYLWPSTRSTILEKTPGHVCHITYTALFPCSHTELSIPQASSQTLRRPAFQFTLWLTTSHSQCQPSDRSSETRYL
ncbi:membrane protein US29 [Mandrillus leucophaeus cytomegalovirus]|uniref:Membrane protein US29 n=1 Tax=Mandrillus leucophaeus cytomegalovirus TaxID=1654930 RepID=A0A0G2UGG2_9BETA|nr:membrane protein US29 [Mandrillus leucophaeus cytomegalovirus]AKI29735.1 membrane protein US29 [Mandrillus leucophaeus cytomegalovirus]